MGVEVVQLMDWEVDLKEVYDVEWPQRGRWNLGEQLLEAPGGRYAVLLYAISEIGVAKEIARIALLEDKSHPRCILRTPGMHCWYGARPVEFDPDGRHAWFSECLVLEGNLANPRRLGQRRWRIDFATASLTAEHGTPGAVSLATTAASEGALSDVPSGALSNTGTDRDHDK